MFQEISIHRSLSHKNIVGFNGFFEDSLNIYIILELCRRRVCISIIGSALKIKKSYLLVDDGIT